MAFPIEQKLVVAVASSALFDLSDSDKVFREKGFLKYRRYQEKHLNDPLKEGVAFPFIRRLLKLNERHPEEQPVEVVLLSRNSPETGLRVFKSIQHHNLNITRGAVLSGGSPYRFIEAFNVSLFLSANNEDVRIACENGFPAGFVLNTSRHDDDEGDDELRVAFDFDGVIADDTSERIYKDGGLDEFQKNEQALSEEPINPGPLRDLFVKISNFQIYETNEKLKNPEYKEFLKVSIVTARNSPAHERVINTLKQWKVTVNEMFFLGGIDKSRIINEIQPHIFFDDQKGHLTNLTTPAVHIPFGIRNESE